MKKNLFHKILSMLIVATMLCSFVTAMAATEVAEDKPVIGISWAYDEQAAEYAYYKAVIEAAGGIAVELPQITSSVVKYDEEGDVLADYLEPTGMLKVEYAEEIKKNNFGKTNVASALDGIDGVFFTGGEDISPSLYAISMTEDNEGEGINATRDISDYTLMAYAITCDIPVFAVCRGEQMLGIVSGCEFTQDIPNYYESLGADYNDTHRMAPDAPNRDYARHDVEIIETDSLLYGIVGDTVLENVSSWHHQCVQSVEGTNLTVVAKTVADGVEIIEGLERQDKTFCLGVQFHPENDCGMVLVDGQESPCDYETCLAFFEALVDAAAEYATRPTIGITWKSNNQNYDSMKTVIRVAGGIPVELGQVTSDYVGYDANGAVEVDYLEASGMLKQEYADKIKAKDLDASNAAAVMADIDGVFFTGGEDISPSLYAEPQTEANGGEAINATRDISDYTLMAYCIENDVAAFGACRGQQILGIVSGCQFTQELPDYYAANGAEYDDLHRMPADAPNRSYARHTVELTSDDTLLYDIVGAMSLDNVSSWHHQAVVGVEGTDLIVTATSTSNGVTIVEGLQVGSCTFVTGVQFHPENDVAVAYHNGNPAGALCDLEACENFFINLVEYAAK